MDVRLETQRLTLRPWCEHDIAQLVQGLNDLEVAKWLLFVPHPYTTADAQGWINRCQGLTNAGARPIAYEFAVELKSERRVIGGVSLSKIDWSNGTGSGGLWIARDYHRRGYGREAYEARIRFAFGELGLTKLVNGYFDGNANSWAMQRSLGYRPAGEKTNHRLADGRQTVEHHTVLLRSDWERREA